MVTGNGDSGFGPEQRKTLSRTFFIFAWMIEFSAAGTGIMIALDRMRAGTLEPAHAFVLALPFFAVAVMEMTKIPLCTVIYHVTSKAWRNAFIIGLSLTMFITFETFYMGFESYNAQLEKRIQPLITKIENIRLTIDVAGKNLSASQAAASQKSQITQQHQDQINTINSQYGKKIESIKNQEKNILEKYQGSKDAVNLGIKNTQSDIKRLEKRLSEIDKDEGERIRTLSKSTQKNIQKLRVSLENDIVRLNAEKKNIRDSADKNKESIRKKATADFKECAYNCDERFMKPSQERIAKLDSSTEKKLAEIDSKIDNIRRAMAQPGEKEARSREERIRSNFTTQRKAVQDQINELTAKLEKRTEELSRLRGKISLQDKTELEELTRERKTVATELKAQTSAANKQFEARIAEITSAQEDASETQASLQILNTDLVEPCNELNSMVADEQVYRLAMQLHGIDNACDLKQEELSLTQFLWFGSLALVTSALGTTLAFAGLVIKYPPSFPSGGGAGLAITGLFRRMSYALALLHRRLRRPKIKKVPIEKEVIKVVTKEVPVEKVVYRDVPREVVKKELVHVPLFTQDLKAVVKND
jgi:chromosome segregation ATPase